MKMEVIAVQQQYQTQYHGVLGSNKIRDWTSTLTAPTAAIAAGPYLQNNTTNKIKNSINKKTKRNTVTEAVAAGTTTKTRAAAAAVSTANSNNSNNNNQLSCYHHYAPPQNNLFYCDDIDAAALQDLSLRLLDELRAAKSRHLTCTEVSLPCDLTPRIAAEILRVSAKEPCGIRGCTVYIEFEDEPNNSRRIATLKLDAETVSTFEIYLTLRQDHRGWTALLPQFMKSLARTITISPEFTITKHKLYTPPSYGASGSSGSSAAIATPTATATATTTTST